jgi:hypothetical protein
MDKFLVYIILGRLQFWYIIELPIRDEGTAINRAWEAYLNE